MWWLLPVLCSPATGADLFEGKAYYYGDLHAHTGISGDGASSDLGSCAGECGALEDFVALAQGAGLDFVAMTDHVDDQWAAGAEPFERGVQLMLEGHQPGVFLTLPGAELSPKLGEDQALGHKTLLLFGEDALLEGLTLEDVRPAGEDSVIGSCDALWDWAGELEERFGPALLVPHHPAGIRPEGTDWTCHSGPWSPVVEVYSDHGSSMGDGQGFDLLWDGTRAERTVHAALDWHGHHLGFVAGTDRHDTHPGHVCQLDSHVTHPPYGGGLTVAVLDEEEDFDRPGLYEALRTRSAYATSGPMIPASLTWSSGGAVLGSLGEEVGLPPGQSLQADVGVPLEWAHAVREVVAVSSEGDLALEPVHPGAWRGTLAGGLDWVYVRVEMDGRRVYGREGCDDGGLDLTEYLWLSPIWPRAAEGDLDGDGLSWGEGDCHDGDAAVRPGLDEVCDNEVDDNCDGLLDGRDPGCEARPEVDPVPDDPGVELPPAARPPVGCAHGAASGWLAWLVVLGLRRRGP